MPRPVCTHHLHSVLVGSQVVRVVQQFNESREVLARVIINVDYHSPLTAFVFEYLASEGLSCLTAKGMDSNLAKDIGRSSFFESGGVFAADKQFFGFEEGFFHPVHEGEVDSVVVQFGGLFCVVGEFFLEGVKESELSGKGL